MSIPKVVQIPMQINEPSLDQDSPLGGIEINEGVNFTGGTNFFPATAVCTVVTT